ncbi:hypothetical protein [Candidatus Villigracilis saccharophilus]|uniref:thiolase C-terminal domain-containing protein n=1 Tax=Candidatus Villigracilis saccharophilus TaxID=3140684 RepID=UPI0031EBC526
MAALSLEASGFAERGGAFDLLSITRSASRQSARLYSRRIKKHEVIRVGATGMYQLVEVVQQLRGECGPTQVDGAKIGMAQNIGGSGATILTHILRSEN